MKKGQRTTASPEEPTINPTSLMTNDTGKTHHGREHWVWVDRPDMVEPKGPMSPDEQARYREAMEAIRTAWIGEGEALSRLRHLQAHRDQRTTRGRPIPTEAGRWKAYLEQEHGLTVAEAAAAMRAFHNDLARQHHSQAQPEVA